MTHPGYVYVTNWEQFQHGHKRSYPWIKLYPDLLGNEAWLDLSDPDRILLLTIWMLCGRYGNGRVKADSTWLKSQSKTRKSSLARLNQAGFIEVRATKGAAPGYQSATPDRDIEKEPLNPQKKEPPKPVTLNGHHPPQKLREAAHAAYQADRQRYGDELARRQLEADYPTVAKYVLDTTVESGGA